MDLVKITKKKYPIEIDLLYATKKNFTGKQIYKKKDCYLHKAAIPFFEKSIELALKLNLKLKIFDAFRPAEAQWKLWEHTPDETFIAHPKKGSPHSRGVAIELSSALVIITGSRLKIPLSTTHCQVGATVGVGLLENTRTCSGINCKMLVKTAIGWIVTCLVVGSTTALLVSQGVYSPTVLGWGSCVARNITV